MLVIGENVMAEKQILPVVIIDFLSAERTMLFIQDFINASPNCELRFIIVDNADNMENQKILIKNMSLCDISDFEEAKVFCNIEKNIYVVIPGGNLGFARGNNVGFLLAKKLYNPQLVLFSNNDIRFPCDFRMEMLIQVIKERNDAGVVGPKVVGLDGKQQSPCREMSLYQRWWKKMLLWPLDRIIDKIFKIKIISNDLLEQCESGEVYRVIGAFMLCDAYKFEKAGKFDEKTFLYAEELILSERMKKKGYKTYYESGATIIHEGGFTTKKNYIPLRKLKQRLESELYYYKEYKKVKPIYIKMTKVLFSFYSWKISILKK